MAFAACIEEIEKAAGRKLSDDEMDDLLSELQRRQRQKKLEGKVDEDAALAAAEEYAKDMAHAALIEKRNALINLKTRMQILDYVKSNFANAPELGLEAVLTGVNAAVRGARNSAAAAQTALRNQYLGGFVSDVEKTGLWREFISGDLDLDIARALWAKGRGDDVPNTVPDQAVRIADVIAKWQEKARLDANKAGASIGRLDGYITRQSHDMGRIGKAGFKAWHDEILPRLDLARMNIEGDVGAFLREVYRGLASGVHLKATSDKPTGLKGPRNIAKAMSHERVLHFKTADDWFAYNHKFGTQDLRGAVMRGLELSAEKTGLMRRLGTNPQANFDMIADFLMNGIKDEGQRARLQQALDGKLKNQMAAIDGTTRTPVSHMGAQIGSGLRTVQNMAKLGAAFFSQFSDLPIYASEMRYQGGTMLSGVLEGLEGLMKGRNRREMAEIDGMLGVFHDGMTQSAAARFSIADDDIPGALAKSQRLFFKFNLMQWWTDTLRATAARAMAHRLAIHRNAAWGKIDPDLRRVLGLFGIDEGRWDVIRAAATKQADGRDYVVPEAILEVGDDLIDPLLAGKKTQAARKAMREEIADQLRTYYSDRAEFAVIMPDARTRATMQRGTRAGTVEGEFLRFIGQFKSFTAAVTQKVAGREVYGRGAAPGSKLSEALKNGNGELLGLAQLILWTTAFGYASMAAKDLAKGRTPRDPRDPKTWMAAMVQGGGAGIYGDFLFGEVRNRFGGGLISTMAGPVLGGVEDIADLYGRVRNGDDAAAAAFRALISNAPFANLFYTRAALDYLILYQIQETLSPGSLRRMEKRIEKENAQTFLLRPSQAVQ